MNDYIQPPLIQYLQQKSAAVGTPVSGTFELTPLCNMACKMCYVRLDKKQMEAQGSPLSLDEWLDIAADAREAGLLFLLLTGGEPLVYPEFRELYSRLSKMGFILQINTNGTLITPEWVEFFKKQPPLRMNITLYGTSDAAYQRLCGEPKGYTRVDGAIKLLIEAGIPIKLNCSVTPHNETELEPICRYAVEHNLELQVASYMFPPARNGGQDHKNHRLSPERTALASARAYELLNGEAALMDRLEKLRSGEAEPMEINEACILEGDRNRCSAGRSAFWVTWKGEMLPCGLFDALKEDIKSLGFLEAWDRIRKGVEAVRLPEGCAVCDKKTLCQTCMAMVYCEEGNLKNVPTYRCRLAEAYRPAVERIADGKQKH